MAERLNGILLVDKPKEFTSHDVVAKLRRLTGERRIGHSCTLTRRRTDCFIVFIGRRRARSNLPKPTIIGLFRVLRPGITTDTQDITDCSE
jgi:tRNA pseudouridine55 synthase